MDVFVKVLGLLIGLTIVFFGGQFLFRSKRIVQAIQKRKFGKTAEPRKEELLFARILGGALVLTGLYYAVGAFLSLL